MNETTVLSEIQDFVEFFGFWISKEKFVEKVYHHMKANGHNCYILNGKYIWVDGEEYQFIKSHKENRWIVKPIR